MKTAVHANYKLTSELGKWFLTGIHRDITSEMWFGVDKI